MKKNFRLLVGKILSAALVFILLAPSFSALAVNRDYMSADKWYKNPKVSKEYRFETADSGGYFSYYTDDELCLYTCIKSDSPLDSGDAVMVVYTFSAGGEEYSVCVDKSGITDDTGREAKARFGAYCSGDKYHLLSAVQYKAKDCTECEADVDVYINGRVCRLTQSKKLGIGSIYMQIPTTTKPMTTTKKKAQKKKTTRPKTKANTANSKTTKSEAKTKFKPSYTTTKKAKAAKKTTAKSTEKPSENAPASPEEARAFYKEHPVSFAVVLLSVLLVMLALSTLLASAMMKKKSEDENEEKEDKE